jgi:hypothetical protein
MQDCERQYTHIVAAKDANDLATAVELNEQAAVEVLYTGQVGRKIGSAGKLTFFNSGCA